MFYDDPDDMDYEYTNPQYQTSFNSRSFLSTQPCFQKESAFMSSTGFFTKSLFDTKELHATDEICNLLSGFSLQEQIEQKDEKIEKDTKIEPTFPKYTEESKQMTDTTNEEEEKEEKILPLTTTTTTTPASIASTDFQPITHHSPTFIYNQAPLPHIDPFAEKHSTIYYITSLLKVGFFSIIFTVLFYLFIQFARFIHQDMNAKITNYEFNQLNEQKYCQRQYEINNCSPNTRLPAIADLCENLENCLWRPLSVSKARILAETLADIANGFSDAITVKTMCLSILTGFGIIWSITNVLTRTRQYNKANASTLSSSVPASDNRLLTY
ncbi:hypothetical protein RMCBS344292_13673 [Rhizopus microsporus]|nr:hypothetical protein RMCBS344292_13673 [Rhizopus microsporus]